MGRGDQATLTEGRIAPDVPLSTLDGAQVRLSSLVADGPVLLAFYKGTCPVCQLTLPFLNRIGGGNLRVYAVSQDNETKSRAFAREFGIEYDFLIDPSDLYEASNAFGITHVPSMFLIGPDLQVRWASFGFVKADLEELGQIAGSSVIRETDNVPAAKPG
jgi:peroxiredoxin